MARLGRYEAFVEIIERGSLTAAAKRLDRSLQSISRALATLEDELGVELIRRTTRRMHPTPAGHALYSRLKAALVEINRAKADAKRETATVGGLFRIGASVLFAQKFVVPSAAAFTNKFPDVQIDMILSDTIADLIEDRLDVAIRIGELGASSLRSKKIGELHRTVVASPAYLAVHGIPQTPADLAAHSCVVRTFGPEGDTWPLIVRGELTRIPVKGTFRCNDAAAANVAVLSGLEIGMAPLWQARQDIDEGRLVPVLSDYEPPPIRVSAVWPGSAETPARTRLFVEMLGHRLRGERI